MLPTEVDEPRSDTLSVRLVVFEDTSSSRKLPGKENVVVAFLPFKTRYAAQAASEDPKHGFKCYSASMNQNSKAARNIPYTESTVLQKNRESEIHIAS